MTVFEVFEYLESSACLYYCSSLLCLTSIKVSSIFLLPRLLHTPIRDSIIMFYLHLPLSLFSIIKYVIYRRSQRHIEGRANSSRSGYIYTISLQNMFTLRPWTSIQNKQYYTGKILIYMRYKYIKHIKKTTCIQKLYMYLLNFIMLRLRSVSWYMIFKRFQQVIF